MLFNSLSFLASFAALTLICYVLPHRFRWVLLTAASLGFYALFRPSGVLFLLGVTLVAYAGELAIGGSTGRGTRTAVLTASVVLMLAALVCSKFSSTFFNSFATSVGVSFYTFSCISYLADVHGRRTAAERHLGYFTLYVSFFPKAARWPHRARATVPDPGAPRPGVQRRARGARTATDALGLGRFARSTSSVSSIFTRRRSICRQKPTISRSSTIWFGTCVRGGCDSSRSNRRYPTASTT